MMVPALHVGSNSRQLTARARPVTFAPNNAIMSRAQCFAGPGGWCDGRSASIPSEHHARQPADEQRQAGGGEPIGEAVVARRVGDDLLEAHLVELERRALASDQHAVG